MVNIPPIKMVMTGGWCKWHCFTNIVVIVCYSCTYIYNMYIWYYTLNNVGPTSYVCWFINPMKTIVIGIINHSYWSYVRQLSYRLGAPHCSYIIYCLPTPSSTKTRSTGPALFVAGFPAADPSTPGPRSVAPSLGKSRGLWNWRYLPYIRLI